MRGVRVRAFETAFTNMGTCPIGKDSKYKNHSLFSKHENENLPAVMQMLKLIVESYDSLP
jgi:hypothetical protein